MTAIYGLPRRDSVRPEWVIIDKSEENGLIEYTSAYHIPNKGCIVKTLTLHTDENGKTCASESLIFIPEVAVGKDGQGNPYLRKAKYQMLK